MKNLERILYVEDDPDIQSIGRLSLEKVGGFTVLCCSSGEQALERAPEFSPQLIVLDVMMPGMDGVDTLHGLRALPGTANTPTVFMTAKAQPREVAELRRQGAIDVLTKPFNPMTLSAQLLTLWQLLGT